MRTVRFIEQRFGVAPSAIAGVARGASAPLLLHTAVIERVGGRLALLEPLLSYESLVSSRLYPLPYLQSAVPAALTAYDLPDLAASFAPGKVLLFNPRDGSGAPADAARIQRETAVISRGFSAKGNAAGFVVLPEGGEQSLAGALVDWLN
jgi:hypothetical protein